MYAGHALAYLLCHALPELPVGGEDVGPDEVEYTPIYRIAVELQLAMFIAHAEQAMDRPNERQLRARGLQRHDAMHARLSSR